MTSSNMMILRDILLRIRDFGPRSKGLGICANAYNVAFEEHGKELAGEIEDYFLVMFAAMGYDPNYPVKPPNGADSYLMYIRTKDKWIGAYGDARRALLDQCIIYLQENRDV